MKLAEQWSRIESELPERWSNARLRVSVTDAGRCDRAASLLGSLMPGRRGAELTFMGTRTGATSPFAIRKLLRKLDSEGIGGKLEVVSAQQAEEAPVRRSEDLARAWDAQLEALPSDWSDLYCELELESSAELTRAALLLAPVNPAKHGVKAFRFRCARRYGYGVSPEMARRCFERLDEEGIRGEIRILHALSDTNPVATQGPVWYVDGKAV